MSIPTLRYLWRNTIFAVSFFQFATFQAASANERSPADLLEASVHRYGSLDRYECKGLITSTRSDTSPDLPIAVTGDGPSQHAGPPITRDWYFEFSYTRNGSVFFYFYAGKTPAYSPLLKIESQENGTLRSYNAVDVRRTGGIPINNFSNVEAAANLLGDDSQWIFPFLLDLLEPHRHYKLLEERPKAARPEKIDGVKHKGVQLKANTQKSIWIDSESLGIQKVRYITNRKTRRSEIEQLQRQLESIDDNEVELGNRIANEIDGLENSPNKGSARYTYLFTYQSFN